MAFIVAAFYRFVPIPEPEALRSELSSALCKEDLCGTVLIAGEGINATLAGSDETIGQLLNMLADKVGLSREAVKFSQTPERPFGRLKIKVKPEIITFRTENIDPTVSGQYVSPDEWNELIADPEVLLLDTRNRYETSVGTFVGAIDPGIETFSEFATYVRENMDPTKHRKIAMFCTGGIRCEKASAFMLQEGFPEVYHLKGGILRYLEDVPEQDSKWQGACYVFDRRDSIRHRDFESDGVEPSNA